MHSDFDIGEDVVSPYLWSRGIHRLDAVAVTHAHSDHMGGMAAVLANFHPRELWLGAESRSPELQELLEDANHLDVVVIHRKAGDSNRTWGQHGPHTRAHVQSRYEYSEEERRFSGDEDQFRANVRAIGRRRGEGEEEIVAREQPQADLLKVAHHGSATSTIPELLAAVIHGSR